MLYILRGGDWCRLEQSHSTECRSVKPTGRETLEKEFSCVSFRFCCYPLCMQGRTKGEKAALGGGPLQDQGECIAFIEDRDAESTTSPPEVIIQERREEHGDDESLHKNDYLAAKMDSLSQPMGKKDDKAAASLYRPITREELQTLKETENLFRSNLLKLQVHTVHVHIRIWSRETPSSPPLSW